MNVTVTAEQKWVMGALGIAILGAVPSFFMSPEDRMPPEPVAPAASSTPVEPPVEVVQPKGEAVPIVESQWAPRSMSSDEQVTLHEMLKVDLNHADKDSLNSLSGVGDVIAQRIVDYREAHGCFRDVEELREVQGLGGSKFDSLQEFIRVDPTGCKFKDGAAAAAVRDAPEKKSKRSKGKSSKSAGGLVNINTADLKELDTLPDIGKKRAQDIIDYRNEHGPFGSVDELLQVKGIKESTFEKIKDLVTTN